MFQTILMFIAAPQNLARTGPALEKRSPRMATRAKPAALSSRTVAHGESATEIPVEDPVTWPTVVGNALGFSLLMTGLWLVLRLAEALLP